MVFIYVSLTILGNDSVTVAVLAWDMQRNAAQTGIPVTYKQGQRRYRMCVTWSDYVGRVTRGLTQTQIADRAGIAQSSVGRWLRGDPPDVDKVLAFAHAFGQPAVEALIAAGHLQASDVSTARTPITAFSTEELLDELRRRIITGEGRL